MREFQNYCSRNIGNVPIECRVEIAITMKTWNRGICLACLVLLISYSDTPCWYINKIFELRLLEIQWSITIPLPFGHEERAKDIFQISHGVRGISRIDRIVFRLVNRKLLAYRQVKLAFEPVIRWRAATYPATHFVSAENIDRYAISWNWEWTQKKIRRIVLAREFAWYFLRVVKRLKLLSSFCNAKKNKMWRSDD